MRKVEFKGMVFMFVDRISVVWFFFFFKFCFVFLICHVQMGLQSVVHEINC